MTGDGTDVIARCGALSRCADVLTDIATVSRSAGPPCRDEVAVGREVGEEPCEHPTCQGHAGRPRRGGRSILIIIWHLLSDPRARYRGLGSDFYDHRIGPDLKKRTHVRQLEALGQMVTLEPAVA